MNKPVFVETSEGLINLSLIYRIVESKSAVGLWFDPAYSINLPVREWDSVRDKMISEGLLVG
jgi:hypothetical protein